MAKVGNISLLYDGENSIRHDIYYTQSDMFHIKGLSPEFIGITDFKTRGYETELLLIQAAKQACNRYRELKKKTMLVILYKCEASTELTMNKIRRGSYSGKLKGVSKKIQDCPFGSSLAVFGIDFRLAQVVDDGVGKRYYNVNEETMDVSAHEMSSVGGFQEMDFTEARYQFFLSLVEGMKKMVVSASRFFGADPEDAAMFIENNPNLLLSGSENETKEGIAIEATHTT